MDKYTYKDVIIDPESEEARNCIGKKCYHADNPTSCIDYANSNDEDMIRILQCIQSENNNFPFCFGTREEYNHACIILKKEEDSKYVPFINSGEFISEFEDNTPIMHIYGLWIYENIGEFDGKIPKLVTEMWGDGVIVGSDSHTTKWEDLLERFVFENGEPCGKLQEENNG